MVSYITFTGCRCEELYFSSFRYAIGNAERKFSNTRIGWLEHLATDTQTPYEFDKDNNKTIKGPSLKVVQPLLFR